MARTADYVVKKVLDFLVVGASEASIPAVEAQNIVDLMNDYMFSIDVLGVTLGYTEVKTLGDIVTVPAGAIRGVIANVGLAAAPGYDVPITQAMILSAKAGLKAMNRLSGGIAPTRYPSTLPSGSGNTGRNGFRHDRFYPDLQNTILAETSGNIVLEENTAEQTP